MLNKLLEDYKDLTIKLINEVSNAENLQVLIDERKDIIDNIKTLNHDKNELEDLMNSLNIIQIDQELIHKIKKESVNARKALENVRRLKQAREVYDKEEGVPVYFNMVSY